MQTRSRVSKLVLFAVVMLAFAALGVVVQPALAFDPGDGRYEPDMGDRVAVYVRDGGVEVWGIDGNNGGMYLTTFSASDLASGETLTVETEAGTITLKQITAPEFLTYYDESTATYVTVCEAGGEYTVSWVSSQFGANGQWPFSKTFDAAYVG